MIVLDARNIAGVFPAVISNSFVGNSDGLDRNDLTTESAESTESEKREVNNNESTEIQMNQKLPELKTILTRISVNSLGKEADRFSINPSINLVAADTNNISDIFLRDRLNGTGNRILAILPDLSANLLGFEAFSLV